jgi:Tol biopolymer transport system component
MLSWSPDGNQLAVTDLQGDNPKAPKFVSWLVDLKTQEKTPLKLPDNQMVTDWSQDGRYFLTTELDVSQKPPTGRLHLVRRDGSEDRVLTGTARLSFDGRLSPDGRRVLYMAPDPQRKGQQEDAAYGLFVLDIRRGKSARVEGQPLNSTMMGFCWSPDGKRLAYAWRQLDAAAGQQTESHLVVAEADGRNPVTVATERGEFEAMITVAGPDWR